MITNQSKVDLWREAYVAANGKEAPEVTYENGWFYIHSQGVRRAVRAKQLEQMTETLRERN